MLAVVNLLLVLAASVAGLVSLFGNTWEADRRRLTRIGRWAVACMVATLSLGVAKEYLTARKESLDAAEIKHERELVQEGLKLLAIAQANEFRANGVAVPMLSTHGMFEELPNRPSLANCSVCGSALCDFASRVEGKQGNGSTGKQLDRVWKNARGKAVSEVIGAPKRP